MCANGQLGKIRKIAVEYLQGWLTNPIEARGRSRPRGDPIRRRVDWADALAILGCTRFI